VGGRRHRIGGRQWLQVPANNGRIRATIAVLRVARRGGIMDIGARLRESAQLGRVALIPANGTG
jgi:hypothetical protein